MRRPLSRLHSRPHGALNKVAFGLQVVRSPRPIEGRRRAGKGVRLFGFQHNNNQHNWNPVLLQVTKAIGEKLIVESRLGVCISSIDEEVSGGEAMERPKCLVSVFTSTARQ